MKFKKTILIMLLLAVLTIGAVSADNGGDALAANDAGDEQLTLASIDEDVVETPDTTQELSANPEDFNVTFTDKEIDVNDENANVVRFYWPDDVKSSDMVTVEVEGGSSPWFEPNAGETFRDVTFGELYIFEPGTYNLAVKYNYDDLIATGTIKVTKSYTAKDFIEMYDKTITDPSDYVCNVFDSNDIGLNGEVSVLANGSSVYANKFSGNGNTVVRINGENLAGDLKGIYNIRVVYKRATDGKEYFKESTITFGSSEPAVPDNRPVITFIPEAPDVDYGDDVVVKVQAFDGYNKVNKTFSGNVLAEVQYFKDNWITVDSAEIYLRNGVGSVKFSNLNVNNYDIFLKINDTDAYKVNPNYCSFKVIKAESEILFDDAIVELNYGKPSNITVDFKKAAAITAKIDGENAIVNGNVITVPVLSRGTHILEIATVADDNCYATSKEVTLNVTKPISSIVLDGEFSFDKGTSTDITVTTEDAIGFNASIKDHPEALSINGNVITISGLSDGKYILSVTTIVDDDHIAVTENATITVKYRLASIEFSDDKIVFDEGASGSIIANVSNGRIADALVIAHKEAVIKIEGNKITVSNLTAGNYTFSVSSKPNAGYSGTVKNVDLIVNPVAVKQLNTTVTASKVSVAYGTSKNIVVTLKDSDGNLLDGKKITVVLNGVTYDDKVTSEGKVSIAVPKNLAPKTYTATINFAGDASYAPSNGTVNVVVSKAAVKLTASAKTFKKSVKTKKYTVTLKNNLNKVMKNTKVTLKVNKKTYTTKTNAKGQATFKITKLTKKGKYALTVKYAGSKYYNAKSVKSKITVK